MLQVVRGRERLREIDAARSRDAIHRLLELPIVRYPTQPLVERAWALRHNFTAYDAMYVALAEALATSLVTTDERLARATRAHSAARAILLTS